MKGCVIVSDNKYPLALPVGTILSGQYVIEVQLGSKPFKAEVLSINEYAKKDEAPMMYKVIG